MIRSLPLVLAPAALLLASGCAKEEELRVTDAWVRMAAVPDSPSAGYFTVHGGPQDVQLLSVSSPVAIRSEMHETMTGMTGMAAMQPITSVAVPAGEEVAFEPGGRHVMLWGINPGIAPPKRLTLILTFSNGARLQVPAQTVAAGAAAPGKD
jgi:copper(I)-binding protein